jgi:hypothetical protein
MSDERHEDEKGPHTLADLLGMAKDHQRRHQHTEGLFDALMAAMGDPEAEKRKEAEKEEEIERDRQVTRTAIDSGEEDHPMQVITLIVTRTDGKQLLVASTVIPPFRDGAVERTLADLNIFLSSVVLSALRPDERATVRVHTFDAEFLSQHATETIEGPALAARVRAFEAEQERQEALKKYRKCCACDDQDCKRRITEPPANVAPEPSPTPESEF